MNFLHLLFPSSTSSSVPLLGVQLNEPACLAGLSYQNDQWVLSHLLPWSRYETLVPSPTLALAVADVLVMHKNLHVLGEPCETEVELALKEIPEALYFDFRQTGSQGAEVVAMRKTVLDPLLSVGNVAIVDLESAAIWRCLKTFCQAPKTFAALYLTNTQTAFYLFDDDQCLFFQVDDNSEHLTNLKQSREKCFLRWPQLTVEKYYVGGNIPLEDFLEQWRPFSAQCVIANPWQSITINDDFVDQKMLTQGAAHWIACGLALRAVSGAK